MKNFITGLIIFLSVWLIVDSVDRLMNPKPVVPPVSDIQAQFEKAREISYAEGQIDAINGDIRVEKIDDKRWRVTKSFWDDGSKMHVDTLLIIK